MNPANFPNVGAAAMPGAPNPGQPTAQNNQVFRHILQVLQSQGPFTGWRAEVPPEERAKKTWQMISSLRLIHPKVNVPTAVHAALSFEEKAFREAHQKDDYENECTNKLHAIKETRVRQKNLLDQNQNIIQNAGAMPGAPNAQFPQMTRPMQTSPIPSQMPMQMGMNDPSMMQSQARQQQQLLHQQMQMGQQRLMTGVSFHDELASLTQPEYDHACAMAAQYINNIAPEQLEQRRADAANNISNNEAKQAIIQKYGDVLTYMARVQCARRIRHNKRNSQMTHPNMMGSDAMMNNVAAQRQMGANNMMGLQRNATLPTNPQQTGLDPSAFMGNVENIQGQQADGLRSQEAGQLVVPASSAMGQQGFANPTAMFQQPGATPQNGQGPANRPGVNPQQFLTPQQMQNAQSAQHDLLQQNAQFQGQTQPQTPFQAQAQAQAAQAQAQARAQAALNAKMAMANQQAQNTPKMNQNIPNQSPAMPMINRPVGPSMSPAQAAAQGRPPSRPQQPGNQPQATRAQLPASLPPALQERLAQMPPEKMNAFLLNQRRALANNQAKANGQTMAVKGTVGQQPQNGQLNDPAAMRNMQQQLGGMAGAPPQNNPMLQGQQMSMQQQQQRQQLIRQQQLMRQQNMGGEMTPDQVARMDRVPFPPQILNNNANLNPPVPPTVKTWGQLKEWVLQNPQVLGQVDLPKLSNLQRLHLVQSLNQHRESGRIAAEQAGQPNWAAPQQPFMQNQNVQGLLQASLPAVPAVTANDIQLARQKLGPQSQNIDDNSIRSLIIRNRQRLLAQQLQNQNLSAQALAQKQGMQQPPSQPQPVPAQNPAEKQPTPSMQPAIPANQPTAMSPAAPAAKIQNQPPASTAGRNAKAGAGAKTTRKRPAPDDVVEVQNPKAQPAPQAAMGQPPMAAPAGAARQPFPFTKEQLASMPPQQRAQIEAQMKRIPRTPLSRAVTEENWNKNLPDAFKNWYNEMSKVFPQESPKLSPEEKSAMAQQLRDSVEMLSRLDTLVQFLIKVQKEPAIKTLFSWRIQIMRQFKPGDWSLNDEFNISPELLKKALATVREMFTAMLKSIRSQQLRGNPPNAPVPVPGGQSNVAPLNASNLEQHQQQEEAKRARRVQNQTVPAAPTSAQPPFPLGAPSPQGVPQAYGPGGFSPDKMKIPQSKRRKQSHPVTPATPTAPAPGALPKADTAKQAMFKCSVPECEHHNKGFATHVELERHVEENHKAKEEISDPLQYALDSFDAALGKPVDEMDLVKDEKAAAAVPSQPISLHTAKRDGKEGVPAPLGRVVSQADAKPVSPASQQLLTPRSNVSRAKVSTPNQVSAKAEKDVVKPAPEEKVPMADWTDSAVSLFSIQDAFGSSLREENFSFGTDLFDEFVNADMFMGKAEDTPDSVDSIGLHTQTPKDGEMIKDDTTININDGEDDGPLPLDWFSRPGPMFTGTVYEDPWTDFDLLSKDSLGISEEALSFTIS